MICDNWSGSAQTDIGSSTDWSDTGGGRVGFPTADTAAHIADTAPVVMTQVCVGVTCASWAVPDIGHNTTTTGCLSNIQNQGFMYEDLSVFNSKN